VFQVASEVVGGLVPLQRTSNLASRSTIRTFSMAEICADFCSLTAKVDRIGTISLHHLIISFFPF
jgi:hypothetical protein